jgi:hypothetical protein
MYTHSEPRDARRDHQPGQQRKSPTEGVAVRRGVAQVLDGLKGCASVRLDGGAQDCDVRHDSLLHHSLVIVRHRQPRPCNKRGTGCDRHQMG